MKLKIFLCALLLMLASASALAKGHLWYDKSVPLAQCKKVVVFPLEGSYSYDQADDVLGNDVEKRLKGVNFTVLKRNSQENIIMQDNANLEYLLNTSFATEEERGAAVKAKTNADYYLVCRIREDRVQTDWSPELTEKVYLKAYTESTGGPDGYRKYDETSWSEWYTVPGQNVYLHLLNLDYTLYHRSGRKVMLFQNQLQGYGTSEEEQFKDLLKEFAIALREARKGSAKK